MKVGIVQPCYIPWRGYFDFIASVDLFVFFNDVQYTPRDWRNRNRIKTVRGTEWLSVPVRHLSQQQRICDTEIAHDEPWARSHLGKLQECYRDAPHVKDAMALLAGLDDVAHRTIDALDIHLTQAIAGYLGISTPCIASSTLNVAGRKTERLLNILRTVGATDYLSGPSARDYIDIDAFRAAGIGLRYKRYAYRDYPQQWGEFDGTVTVLDLIANCGPAAGNLLRSLEPDDVVLAPGGG